MESPAARQRLSESQPVAESASSGKDIPDDSGRARSNSAPTGNAALGRYQFDLEGAEEEQEGGEGCFRKDHFLGVKVRGGGSVVAN